MKTEFLNKAIENAECDECTDEVIGFSGKYRNYYINFFGFGDYHFTLVVEEACRKVKGKWVKIEPTKEQRKMMQAKLDKKHTELHQRETERLEEIEVNEPYEERGLSEGDFINYNLKQ